MAVTCGGKRDFAVSFICSCQYAFLHVDGDNAYGEACLTVFYADSQFQPLCRNIGRKAADLFRGYSKGGFLSVTVDAGQQKAFQIQLFSQSIYYFMRRLYNGQSGKCCFVFRLLFSGGEGGSQADFKLYVFSGIYRFSDGPYTVVIRTAAFLYDKRQEALRLSGEPCFAGQREQGDTLRVGGCAGSRRCEVILLECLVVFFVIHLYGNAGHHFSVFVINGYAYTAFFSCVLLLFACYRQEDRTY